MRTLHGRGRLIVGERGYPLLSLVATALIAGGLYLLWRRAGRPGGVEAVERIAESDDGSGGERRAVEG